MTKAPQLTDDESSDIICALIRGAARNGHPDGVPEEALQLRFEQIYKEMLDARIQLAALDLIKAGKLDIWVDDDGEQRWYTSDAPRAHGTGGDPA